VAKTGLLQKDLEVTFAYAVHCNYKVVGALFGMDEHAVGDTEAP